MDNMETENDELISRLNHLEKVTLNRLHRLLNYYIRRIIRYLGLPIEDYYPLKNQYVAQIENISEQAQNLLNDTSSDLPTRLDIIRQLEQQALNLENNIYEIPQTLQRLQKYQPDEEPEPDESEEQMGGRRKHRKSRKHRKTKHHNKRKTRHNRKKTRRHRY